MLLDTDFIDRGSVPREVISSLQELAPTIDWKLPDFDRNGIFESRTVRVPYSVRQEPLQPRTAQVDLVLRAFDPVDQWMHTQFSDCVFVKCEINWLTSGQMLPYHKDPTWWHQHSHRIHIPIVTNPDCWWIVEERRSFFHVGRYYEINNRKYHSYTNEGHTGRLHLVFDVLNKAKYLQAQDQGIDINTVTCPNNFYTSEEFKKNRDQLLNEPLS